MTDQRVLTASGPRGWPYLGVLPHVSRDLLGFFCQTTQRYKPLGRFKAVHEHCVLLSEPALIGEFYKQDVKRFHKGKFYQVLQSTLGKGLLIANGDAWKQQRQHLQPLFAKPACTQWLDIIGLETERLMRDWEPYAARHESVALMPSMYGLTQRVISKVLFGRAANAQHIDAIFAAVMVISEELLRQIIRAPILGGLLNQLPLPGNQRFQHSVRIIHQSVDALIAEFDPAQADPDAILTHLKRLERDGADVKSLRDDLITLYIAGLDTNALALIWTVYHLAHHPEHAERVASEASQIAWNRPYTASQVEPLPYTRQVVDESLRLTPPVHFVSRTANEAQQLDGHRIDQNDLVILSQYAMHRDPTLWHDPQQFEPNRFERDTRSKQPRFAYFPYGGGARTCLGIHLAQLELPLVIGRLFAHFRILPASTPVGVHPSLTLRPSQDVKCRVELRC